MIAPEHGRVVTGCRKPTMRPAGRLLPLQHCAKEKPASSQTVRAAVCDEHR